MRRWLRSNLRSTIAGSFCRDGTRSAGSSRRNSEISAQTSLAKSLPKRANKRCLARSFSQELFQFVGRTQGALEINPLFSTSEYRRIDGIPAKKIRGWGGVFLLFLPHFWCFLAHQRA